MRPPRGGAREPIGGLFVALAAVQFGGVVVLGKIVGERGLPVPSMLAVRFAVAAAILAVVLAAARQPLRPAGGEGWRLALLGAVGYAVESALFFLALARGTAAAVTLLFFTYPVWVALLSAVVGMGLPGWLVGGSLVAAVAGASLVVGTTGGLAVTGLGILFALAAAVTFSFYLIGADAWIRRTSSLASAMWIGATAAAALAAFSVASGRGRLPGGAAEWLPVAGMGLLTSGAFFCLFLGLRRLGAVRTSIVAALEPVSTALLALAVLGETLPPGVIGGGLLILAGAIAASLAREAREPEPPEAATPGGP
ncbi:MAG: DMT family transporter [Actinomycetota bacterium]